MLADLARSLPAYADLLARVRRGDVRLTVAGGVGALPGILLAALGRDLGRPLAIVVADEKEAERLRGDLAAGGLTRLYHAPSPTLTPYQRIVPSLKARRYWTPSCGPFSVATSGVNVASDWASITQ